MSPDDLTEAETDAVWAGLQRARHEDAPIPLARDANRTHVLWAVGPAIAQIKADAYAAGLAARTAAADARVAEVEAVARDLADWAWTAPVGPGNASYANGYENGRRSAGDDLRAALSTAAPDAVCVDCGHQHTPTGCAGEPTPSDRWAGVSPAACDCMAPAPDALARERETRAEAVRVLAEEHAADDSYPPWVCAALGLPYDVTERQAALCDRAADERTTP